MSKKKHSTQKPVINLTQVFHPQELFNPTLSLILQILEYETMLQCAGKDRNTYCKHKTKASQ
jgi:hypothetical protein